jgi:glutamyl-tRNA synthetase
MQALPVEKKVSLVLPYLQKAGLLTNLPSPLGRGAGGEGGMRGLELNKVSAVVCAAGDRIKVAGDILDFPEFFVSDDKLTYDPAALKKAFDRPEAAALLKKWLEFLPSVEPFDASTLEKRLHDFVADEGIKIGQIIHPLRVALTGKSVGLGLFDTLAILGRSAGIYRVNQALKRVIPEGGSIIA